MDRRQFLKHSGLVGLAATIVPALAGVAGAKQAAPQVAPPAAPPTSRKGHIKHSVCRWCYGGMKLEELAKNALAIGISSIEILDNPAEWATIKKLGLTCAMATGSGDIPRGWNRKEHHEELVKRSLDGMPKAAEAGIPNWIIFSGNSGGQPDDDGIASCAAGLKQIAPLAEKLGINLAIEFLNSKHDHPDYAFDNMRYGVEVVQKVGSPRMKILYDIYHAQIMEGDVIQTIRDHKDVISHFHTGGVPGRHEIDATQELNYTAVCHAIAETGFQGYVAQEFTPTRDPMTSLREAIDICDV